METRKIDPVQQPLNDLDEIEPITKTNTNIDIPEPLPEEDDLEDEVKPFTVEMEPVEKEEVVALEKTIEVPGSPRLEPFEIRLTEDEDEEKTADLKDELENTEELAESHLEETLTKLKTQNNFDEFKDVSSGDAVGIALKIFAFIIVIGLVIGAVYILDNILELGLF